MVDITSADIADAVDAGFREDTAEKVHRLLGILREIQATTDTRGKFTLKGGTALNIFHVPAIPRLSVDIDLVTTGYPSADPGSPDRQQAIDDITNIVTSLAYNVNVADSGGAGCVIHCQYTNHLGTADRIKVDLDFLNRKLLLEPEPHHGPEMFDAEDLEFPMVARPELVAQKLVAACYRAHVRDVYDLTVMLDQGWHKDPQTRELYLAYSFLKDDEWYRLDYVTKLEEGKFEYQPETLQDVVREGITPPNLDEVRDLTTRELYPDFVTPTDLETKLQQQLRNGDPEAFADILQESNTERRAYLIGSPALQFRLSQIKK